MRVRKREEKRQGETSEENEDKQEEVQELSEEEFKAKMKRLKRRKAPAENGIENKCWLYAPTEIKEGLKNLLKDIWRRVTRGMENWNNQSDTQKRRQKGSEELQRHHVIKHSI